MKLRDMKEPISEIVIKPFYHKTRHRNPYYLPHFYCYGNPALTQWKLPALPIQLQYLNSISLRRSCGVL